MKYIVGLAVLILISYGSYAAGWNNGTEKEARRGNAVWADLQSDKRIEVYNSGYRAGRFEAMAQLVECENIQTPEVLRDYKIMEEVLGRFGELDTAPYPCEE